MAGNIHLVIAPHPDDELLGCGGTLLRAKEEGEATHWAIVTEMKEEGGFTAGQVRARSEEIEAVAAGMGFDTHSSLGFPPAGLNSKSLGSLVASLGQLIEKIQPTTVYLPYCDDVHSDHRIVFEAGMSCSKWFRYPSVTSILSYEVLSETDMNIRPGTGGFNPNRFVDITRFLNKKLELTEIYASEMGEFPFPRSREAIEAQAMLRGAASGFKAAEAFMLLRERI